MALTPLTPKARIALRLETDRSLWLERVVLRHLGGTEYLLLATNSDIEKEDLALAPVLNFRRIRGDRSALGVKRSMLFLTEMDRGDDWTDEELDELLEEADFLIKTRGLKAGTSLVDLGRASPAVPSEKVVSDWRVVRGRDGILSGSTIAPSSDAVFLGDFGLSMTAERNVVIIKKTPRALAGDLGRFCCLDPPPGEVGEGAAPLDIMTAVGTVDADRLDCRLFPIVFDSTGKRHADFRRMVEFTRTGKFKDWPVSGPLTVRWVLRHMLVHGGSPLAWFQRFLSETRLDLSATGISELYGWCKFLETLVCYDQIDPTRLASVELGVRRVQMVCENWKHKLPTSGGAATGDMFDDSHLLLGTSETRGSLCLCPALQTWLGEELAREALAHKERRKAREERALAAKKA